MNYKLLNKNYEKELENKTIKEYILSNRNIDNPSVYLSLTKDNVHHYSLLENINEAKNLLLETIKNKGKIGIICDSDSDGFASASILYQYLARNYDQSKLTYFIHTKKQHGIGDLLSQILKSKIDLLIVPDAGTNDVKECKILQEKNIQVIVLDHHQVEEENPYAVVINNQLGNYPNKYLSGAGVTKKFLESLDDEMWDDSSDFDDLVAISIVADSMSILEYENRYLVTKGLKNIKNKFIQAIIEKQSYSIGNTDNINVNVVAFYISPLINALIRSGSLEEKELMFRAFIGDPTTFPYKKRNGEEIQETMQEMVARLAGNLKAKQNREIDKSLEYLRGLIDKNKWNENKILFVDADGVDYSFTGLVAMRLSSEYQKPCLLIRKSKDNTFAGSARNYGNQIDNLKDYLLETGLFEYAQGHGNSFGLGIKIENIKPAIEKINESLKDINFGQFIYYVDFEIDIENLTVDIIKDMNELYDYYGNGIEESLVLIKNIPLNSNDIEILGKTEDTWKCLYNNEIQFIKFKNDENDIILKTRKNDWSGEKLMINAICKLSISQFGGINIPQAIIVDYEVI